MRLHRTVQCAKCPWRKTTDPREIPNGYCEKKHAALAATIAKPGSVAGINAPFIRAMACHETDAAHCVGWLHNQLGRGNNIALRLQMLRCENLNELTIEGDQHETLEDTLPPPSQG